MIDFDLFLIERPQTNKAELGMFSVTRTIFLHVVLLLLPDDAYIEPCIIN